MCLSDSDHPRETENGIVHLAQNLPHQVLHDRFVQQERSIQDPSTTLGTEQSAQRGFK